MNRRWLPGTLAGLILAGALASPAAQACGYEDPQSVAMGALNFAYPDALHVGTAIWQAQADGLLPRAPAASSAPPVKSFAVPAPGTVAADPAGVTALWEVLRLLDRVRDRLAPGTAERQPRLALVFASKMLWTRFVPTAQGLAMQPHATGPEAGDVVVVTEAVVLGGVLDARLSAEQAFSRGLIRLYGDEQASVAARGWLDALTMVSDTR